MIFLPKCLSIQNLFINKTRVNELKPLLSSTNSIFKQLTRNNSSDSSFCQGPKGEKEWKIFNGVNDLSFNLGNYGVLVLNRPINIRPERVSSIWSKASWRITVDGGTDRWFEYVKEHSLKLPLPSCVTGDFDSIKPETFKICKQNNIAIESTPDQNYTDFEKAVNILFKKCPQKLDSFITIADFSGRLDQIFANLNTLSRFSIPGFLLSESDLTWLLHPGRHRIHIPDFLRNSKEWIGILPFSSSAKVSTSGLKWNLDHNTIQFGGLLSSSGTYDGSDEVVLTTDGTVLWTMSYGNK